MDDDNDDSNYVDFGDDNDNNIDLKYYPKPKHQHHSLNLKERVRDKVSQHQLSVLPQSVLQDLKANKVKAKNYFLYN